MHDAKLEKRLLKLLLSDSAVSSCRKPDRKTVKPTGQCAFESKIEIPYYLSLLTVLLVPV